MEISAQNLTALFTGFDVVFQRGFEKPPSYYEQITSVVRSASRQTTMARPHYQVPRMAGRQSNPGARNA
jgi:phage major head subunit gpT-like protein